MKNKNVLFISYSFPPLHSAESIQSSRFSKYLQKQGWNVNVLTVDNKGSRGWPDSRLHELIPSNINILRTSTFESKWIDKFTSRWMPFALFAIPDNKIGWYWCSIKKAFAYISHHKISVIHSRAVPATSHIIALSIKQKTCLPWVAHFSDPWVDDPWKRDFGKLHYKINLNLEQRVIEHADIITFTCTQARDLVLQKYKDKDYYRKAKILPNCFDPEYYNKQLKIKKDNKKLHFIFTGALYDLRTPIPLFDALIILKKKNTDVYKNISITIVGSLQEKFLRYLKDYHIEKIINVISTVPYFAALKMIQQADILLLVDAPCNGPSPFLPSKLVEYLAARKHILGITPLIGASADLIRIAGGTLVDPTNIQGIASAMKYLYNNFKKGKALSVPRNEIVQTYSALTNSKILSDLLISIQK